MSVDKLVDSTQLDADLTSVANAIRTKGGTSASLAFPADFVSAIAAIPTGGGGYTLEEFGEGGNNISGDIVYTSTYLRTCQFMGTAITSFSGATVNAWGNSAVGSERAVFKGCTSLVTVSMPIFNQTSNAFSMFSGCTALKNVYLPAYTQVMNNCFSNCTSLERIALQKAARTSQSSFDGCSSLQAIDFGVKTAIAGGYALRNCSSLATIVLRGTTLSTIENTTNIIQGTPLASGGSGCTIYIPKSLYDHLGDNSSSDYKAATNWSTINGYGTITWAKIEGSIYENAYADGTPIT